MEPALGPARLITRDKTEKLNWWQNQSYEVMGPMQYEAVKVEGGKVTLPELRMWTMVVAEL